MSPQPVVSPCSCSGPACEHRPPAGTTKPDREASDATVGTRLEQELDNAERKAWDSLARYKFTMFGYWCGVWVHLNRISDCKRPNPFKPAVQLARTVRAETNARR